MSYFFLSVLIFNIAACSAIFQNETPANCNMTHMLNPCLRWPSQACHVILCCPWEQFNKSFKQMWCNNWSLVIFVFPFYLIERLIFQWSTEWGQFLKWINSNQMETVLFLLCSVVILLKSDIIILQLQSALWGKCCCWSDTTVKKLFILTDKFWNLSLEPQFH